jgi:hypothetical protein
VHILAPRSKAVFAAPTQAQADAGLVDAHVDRLRQLPGPLDRSTGR